MTAFYGKSSTVLSPQSYYEETVYFLPLRPHSVNPLLWGLNLLPNFLKREGGGGGDRNSNCQWGVQGKRDELFQGISVFT